jgi:hypothetical protein
MRWRTLRSRRAVSWLVVDAKLPPEETGTASW